MPLVDTLWRRLASNFSVAAWSAEAAAFSPRLSSQISEQLVLRGPHRIKRSGETFKGAHESLISWSLYEGCRLFSKANSY